MTREEMAALAEAAVADWPPLTDEQRIEIRAAFRVDPPAPKPADSRRNADRAGADRVNRQRRDAA